MKQLDKNWLLEHADNIDSKSWIDKIIEWRNQVLQNNIFIQDDSEFVLSIDGYKLYFKPSSSFAAIEVFIEIFKENSHFKAPGFTPKNPKLILDIGANQGFFSLKARRLFPQCKIIAIEPNPNEFEVLKKNIANNTIENIIIENIAIGKCTGQISMEIIPQVGSIGGKKIKIPERPWVKDEFIQTINATSLSIDDLFYKFSIEHVDMVKIDVEGFELDILKKSKVLSKIDKFAIEYHNQKLKKELINLLCNKNKFDFVYDDSTEGSYYGEIYFSNNLSKSNKK
jgi:FkbM family methyltransferase